MSNGCSSLVETTVCPVITGASLTGFTVTWNVVGTLAVPSFKVSRYRCNSGLIGSWCNGHRSSTAASSKDDICDWYQRGVV